MALHEKIPGIGGKQRRGEGGRGEGWTTWQEAGPCEDMLPAGNSCSRKARRL